MKTKRIIKWICGIAAVILAALLLLIGRFIYVTRYRISDIDAATSPDGKHEIVFQTIGEPDWPFGYSYARIVLKRNGEIVTKRKFDVANDGGVLHPENWSVRWEENCVKVKISGEEQPDAFYTYYFDGTVRHESLAVQELDNREAVSPEMMFDEPTTDFSAITPLLTTRSVRRSMPYIRIKTSECIVFTDQEILKSVLSRLPHALLFSLRKTGYHY